ncbi:hypothetical protein QJQ45_002948 [Haematococcus lacustris]|nr:hypothetical protein QJQ45_002948 [Haematococcus lacustris]
MHAVLLAVAELRPKPGKLHNKDVPSLAVSGVPVHDDLGASAAVAEAYVAVVSSALQPSQAALYYQSGPFACSPGGPSLISPVMLALSELCAASVLLASWAHNTASSHQRGWGVERGSAIHQPALLLHGRHLLGFDTRCHSPTSMLGLIVATVALSAINIFLLVKVVVLQRKVRRSSLAILRLLGSQLGGGLEAGDAQAVNSFTQDTLVKFMAGAAAAPHQAAPPAHHKQLVHTHCGANGSNLGAGHSTQIATQAPYPASPAMAQPPHQQALSMAGASPGSAAFTTSPASASDVPDQAMSLWGPAAASVLHLPQSSRASITYSPPLAQQALQVGQGGQLPPWSPQHVQGREQGGGNTIVSPSFAQEAVQASALSAPTVKAAAEQAAVLEAGASVVRPGSFASSLTLQVPKEQEGRPALLPNWVRPASSGWSPATSPFAAMGWGHIDSDNLSSKRSGAAAGTSQSSSCRWEPDVPAVAGAGLPYSLSVRSSSGEGYNASTTIAGFSSHASTCSSASHASSNCNSMESCLGHVCSTASVSFGDPRHRTKRGGVLASLLEATQLAAAPAPLQDTSRRSLDTVEPEEGHSASVLHFCPLGTLPASPSPSIACNTHPSLSPSQQPAPASPDPPAFVATPQEGLLERMQLTPSSHPDAKQGTHCLTAPTTCPGPPAGTSMADQPRHLAAGSCLSSDLPLSNPGAGAAAAAAGEKEELNLQDIWAATVEADSEQAGQGTAPAKLGMSLTPSPASAHLEHPISTPLPLTPDSGKATVQARYSAAVLVALPGLAPRPRPAILQVPMAGAALPLQPCPASPLTPTSPVPSAADTQSCLRAAGSQDTSFPSHTISLVHSNSCHNNSSSSLVGGPQPFHSGQAQGLSSSPLTSSQDSTWLQASDRQPQQPWLPSSFGRKMAVDDAKGRISPVFVRATSMVDSTPTDTSLWQSTDLTGHLTSSPSGLYRSNSKYMLPLGHQSPHARSRLSIRSTSLASGELTNNIDWVFSGSAYDDDDVEQGEGAGEEDAGEGCRRNTVASTHVLNATTRRTEPYAQPQDAASLPWQPGDDGLGPQQGASASLHSEPPTSTPSLHIPTAQWRDAGMPLTAATPRHHDALQALHTRSSNSVKINTSGNVPPTGLSSPASHIALPQDTRLLRPGRVSTSGSCDAPYSTRSSLYRQSDTSSGMLVAPQTRFTSSAHLATLSSSLASTAAPSSQGACSPAHLSRQFSRQFSRQSRTSLAGKMGVERVMTMAWASFNGRGGDDVQAALGVPKQLLVEHADSITTPVEGVGPEAEIDVVDVVNDPVLPDVSLDINLEEEIVLDSDKPLGSGTYGAVYSGHYRGLPVAVKFANKGMLDGLVSKVALDTLNVETRILSRVRHPNIVRFYGGCIRPPAVFLVEELLLSDLSELVHNNNLLPLDDVLRIGKDIASGLFHLHPTIIHRDLKPANVLLDHRGQAKIGDFGMARFKLQAALVTKDNNAGTMAYMAPECFHNNTVTPEADVYSWAIIMWEMLTGQLPWLGCNNAAIIGAVAFKGERPDLPDSPQRCPPDLAALITECWQQDPRDRPSTGELVKSISLVMKVRQHHHRQSQQAPE